MANGKQEQNNQNQNGEQQQETQQQATAQVTQQQEPAEEKSGFGNWIKKHWKGVIGTIAAAGAIGGSAVVAYKKGKAAGVMSVPMQEPDDYSLDPNK